MKKSWFTLIEMIIVTVILSILATIGMISYTSNIETSYDTTRKTDMSKLENALKWNKFKNWAHPLPAESFEIVNSWSSNIEVIEWILNDKIWLNTIDTIPFDPRWKWIYMYSITSNRQNYQIAMTLYNWWQNIAYLKWDYKVIIKDVFPSLILAMKTTWQVEVHSWIITIWSTWSLNRLKFILDWWWNNLPYNIETWEIISKISTLNFNELIWDPNIHIIESTEYSTCDEIKENEKYLWIWNYSITNWSWNLEYILCE